MVIDSIVMGRRRATGIGVGGFSIESEGERREERCGEIGRERPREQERGVIAQGENIHQNDSIHLILPHGVQV
jgi:hypothetical protein